MSKFVAHTNNYKVIANSFARPLEGMDSVYIYIETSIHRTAAVTCIRPRERDMYVLIRHPIPVAFQAVRRCSNHNPTFHKTKKTREKAASKENNNGSSFETKRSICTSALSTTQFSDNVPSSINVSTLTANTNNIYAVVTAQP